MFDRGRSGQYLYFSLVSAISGNIVTGASGAISGRRSLDGGALSLLSGFVTEVSSGQGQYVANLFAEDVTGNCIGFLFTASGCVPVNYSVITQQNVSGKIYAASGVNATVPIASISGTNAVVPIASISGVNTVATVTSGSTYLASGSIFRTTFASGVVGGGSGNLPSAWGGSGAVTGGQNLDKSGYTAGSISGTTYISSGQVAFAVWNEILTAATYNVATTAGRRLRTLQDVGDYVFGSVWLDTGGANSGLTFPEDGTFLNPVNTFTKALSVAGQMTQPSKRLFTINGSQITLLSGLYGWNLDGDSYSLAPGGFGLASTVVNNASISGTVAASTSGMPPLFNDCLLTTVVLPPSVLFDCGIQNTLTLNGSGGYTLVNCFSEAQGAASPTINLTSGVRTISLKIRNWRGGLTLQRVISGDVVTIDGDGGVTIDPTCVGGTLLIRGNFTLTNSGNILNLSDSARFGSGNVWPRSGMTWIASGANTVVPISSISGVNAVTTIASGTTFLASGQSVQIASGTFVTVPITSISGVNALVPPANLSGVNVTVPIATISGTNAVVPPASLSGVNSIVPPANLSGVFASVPTASISGVNSVATVASGTLFLASGNTVGLFSGTQVLIASGTQITLASGALSGQFVTLLSGYSYTASGIPVTASVGSGLFVTVPISTISGVNAIIPPANLSGVFVTVPIASISGTNAVVPVASISGVNSVASISSGTTFLASGQSVQIASGTFVTVPIASISGTNAVVPPANLSGVFASVPIATISGVNVVAASGAIYPASGTAGAIASGTVFLASGQSVALNSGQMVALYSGQTTAVWSGTSVNVFSGTVSLTSGEVFVRIPQGVLTRDFTAFSGLVASGVSGRCVVNAERKLVNKWSLTVTSGYLTVYQENDSAVAYTQALTVASGAAPITSMDTD